MATVGKIQVEIEAQNARLASGLKQAEGMVSRSTQKMNAASVLGVGNFRGARALLGGFGFVGVTMAASLLGEELNTFADAIEKITASSDSIVMKIGKVAQAVPFIGPAAHQFEQLLSGGIAAAGGIFGSGAIESAFETDRDAAARTTFMRQFQQMLQSAENANRLSGLTDAGRRFEELRIQRESIAATIAQTIATANALIASGINLPAADIEGELDNFRDNMLESIRKQEDALTAELVKQGKDAMNRRSPVSPEQLNTALGGFSIAPKVTDERPRMEEQTKAQKETAKNTRETTVMLNRISEAMARMVGFA